MLRHAENDPLRPGRHGDFDAARTGTLNVIDEAWAKAQAGGPGVATSVAGAKTTYTVGMGRRVGYVGGKAGAAAGHPAAFHVKIVVENGLNVITAYPLIP